MRRWIAVGVGVVVAEIVVIAVITLTEQSNDAQTRLVVAGTIDDLRAQGIVYLPDEHIFVVAVGDGFLALDDDSRHLGDHVLFCQISGLFESPAQARSSTERVATSRARRLGT